jgi:hypothetical protein
MKQQSEKMVERRSLMQQKLMQIHMKNQQKKKEMLYRNPLQQTPSSISFVSRPSSFQSSPSMTRTGPNFASNSSKHSSSFFNKNAPMLTQQKTPSVQS